MPPACLETFIPGHLEKREIQSNICIILTSVFNTDCLYLVSIIHLYNFDLSCQGSQSRPIIKLPVSLSLVSGLPARYKKLLSSLVEFFMMTRTGLDWGGDEITKKEMTTEFCFLLTSSRPVSCADPDIVVDIHNFRLKYSTRNWEVRNEDQASKAGRVSMS